MSRYSPSITRQTPDLPYYDMGSQIGAAILQREQQKRADEQEQYERRRDTVKDGGEVDPIAPKRSPLSRIGEALGIGRPHAPEMGDLGAKLGGIHDAVNGSFVASEPDTFDPWAAYDAGRGTPPFLPGNRGGSHGGSRIADALRTVGGTAGGTTLQPPVASAPPAPSGPAPRPGSFDAASGVFHIPGAQPPRPTRPSTTAALDAAPIEYAEVAPGIRMPTKASQDRRAALTRDRELAYGDEVADWEHGRDRGEKLGDRDDERRYQAGLTDEERRYQAGLTAEEREHAARVRAQAFAQQRQLAREARDDRGWQPQTREDYVAVHGPRAGGRGPDEDGMTPAMRAKYADASLRLANLKTMLADYRQKLAQRGPTLMVNPASAEDRALSTLYQRVLMASKEAANLGVLNGPDLKLMHEQLPPPFGLKAKFGGVDAALQQIDAYAGSLDLEQQTLDRTYRPNSAGRGGARSEAQDAYLRDPGFRRFVEQQQGGGPLGSVANPFSGGRP